MSKQFITEAQRMQKLAGMPISEMALPEMARTAGTGGAYTITEKGEEILKQAKASGAAPEGIKNSELATLVFLFKAKKDGKRVQKIDYAKERNVPQPAVNPIFNSLEVKELISKEGYTSKQQEPKTSRPRPDVDAMLGDLDIEESKKELSEAKDVDSLVSQKARDMFYNSVRAICDDLRVGGVVDDDTITAYLSEEGGLLGDAIEAYYHNNPDEDIEESKKTLSENQPAIYNDIEQDLMNGGFESTEDQVEYLQDIIKFCQEKIKEISGGLNENIDKDKLKKYYEYLLNLGGGDLGGDYGDMLNKAKDFSSVEEFIEDDINILATDDKKQAIEIRKWVEQNIKESKKILSEDKENIVNFLNANTKEFISKLGNPGSKFENLGDPKVATAGKSDTSGIDVSFDREHMLKLFPKDDPYNKVEEIEIAGKKIYYNDYR